MQIGTVVRLGAVTDGGSPPPFSTIRSMARQIEAAGLDSIWVYDHLLYRWPGRGTDGIWECWTMLSALAEATQRVGLGTLVACTQFRNPALLAKMAVTLDEVSGGRLTLGVGAGWHRPEFDAYGFPFDHRVGRFAEVLQIMTPLLRDGHVDFAGTYYQARDCELIPRGPRGGVPLMVAGAGPRMLELTARYADAWNTAWHGSPAPVRDHLEHMRSVCTRLGRDPRTLGLTVSAAVSYPDLGGHSSRASALSGGTSELAAALRGYADLGVEHLIVELAPYTEVAVDRFAEAVAAYRQAST